MARLSLSPAPRPVRVDAAGFLKANDGLRRAEDRTDVGLLRGTEGIGDREDASTPQNASPVVVAGGGGIFRHPIAVAG